VGDPGAGGIQSHANWRRPEHARHLRIGSPPLGGRQIALVRLGRVRLILL
jgi:hypothetical protein